MPITVISSYSFQCDTCNVQYTRQCHSAKELLAGSLVEHVHHCWTCLKYAQSVFQGLSLVLSHSQLLLRDPFLRLCLSLRLPLFYCHQSSDNTRYDVLDASKSQEFSAQFSGFVEDWVFPFAFSDEDARDRD